MLCIRPRESGPEGVVGLIFVPTLSQLMDVSTVLVGRVGVRLELKNPLT